MLQKLLAALGNFYVLVISVLISAGLCAATWVSWVFYQEVELQSQFAQEGQLRSVVINQVDHEQRSWRDMLNNSAYITFTYQGKDYTARYVNDTSYVREGDRVQLLYHPQHDGFRQPVSEIHSPAGIPKSRLINWTAIKLSHERQVLFLCLLLTSITFFFVSGLLLKFVQIPVLQQMARLLLGLELLALSGFMAYSFWTYYLLYQHIKANGRETTVQVVDTDRVSTTRRSRSRINWYSYQATVQYQQRQRIIPISEADYELLKPTNALQVYSDESADELMSVDYPLDYSRGLVPIVCGALALLVVLPSLTRRKQNRQASSR
ncbi:hypothetical protein GCM10027341_32610 [Spirosoma knui]